MPHADSLPDVHPLRDVRRGLSRRHPRSFSSSTSPSRRCRRRLQYGAPAAAVGPTSSLPPVRAPLMSATAGVPTLPAFTADSVRAAGSSPSAVHRPILPMSLQCTASPMDVSTGRPLASHLTSDGDSRRREIRLGKHPVEEVPAAIVTGGFHR